MESLPENSIDEWIEEGIKQTESLIKSADQTSEQLHRVFVQNPDGAALLSKWKDSLIMVPVLTAESTQFEAGINEGEKRFIRNLITSIQSVEQDL